MNGRRIKIKAAVACAVSGGLLIGLNTASADESPAEEIAGSVASAGAAAQKRRPHPNVVLIMFDDFDSRLLTRKIMPNTARLARQGVRYTNYVVSDSLCCTSRATTLTGKYNHNNGVHSNVGKHGGWKAFHRKSNKHGERRTFVRALTGHQPSYKTALMGKYLNGYHGKKSWKKVPPGWTTWNAVTGNGYREWKYRITTSRHTAQGYVLGKPEDHFQQHNNEDYLTHVLQRHAVRYMAKNGGKKQRPFFLYLAPFATHQSVGDRLKGDPKFPPAPRDRGRKFGYLKAGDLPGFNDDTRDNRPQYTGGKEVSKKRDWHQNAKLGTHKRKLMTKYLRDRARMAQALDRMVGKVRRKAPPNTFIVVTSDNGLHLGQHRFPKSGKGTPYDYDVNVPLIVYKKPGQGGRKLPAGRRTQLVSNVDLAATIRDIGNVGQAKGRDGRSFRNTLWHPKAPGADYVFMEHYQPKRTKENQRNDPDYDGARGGTYSVPSYKAVRSGDALLVRYHYKRANRQPDESEYRYAWEFYRYHPGKPGGWVERTNTYRENRKSAEVTHMKQALKDFAGCGAKVCLKARGFGG